MRRSMRQTKRPVLGVNSTAVKQYPPPPRMKNATLKVYKGYPHGMCTTHADVINKDLLEFIRT